MPAAGPQTTSFCAVSAMAAPPHTVLSQAVRRLLGRKTLETAATESRGTSVGVDRTRLYYCWRFCGCFVLSVIYNENSVISGRLPSVPALLCRAL